MAAEEDALCREEVGDYKYFAHYFEYKDDDLYWRVLRGRARPGALAGRLNSSSYYQVTLRGDRFLVHRIIWLLAYGSWPSDFVAHKDGNKSNNKISNLFIVPGGKRKIACRGVSFNKVYKHPWLVRIRHEHVVRCHERYRTYEEAQSRATEVYREITNARAAAE